jgi:prepilin-type N-terminal cleavage/methylation domain-containing protein
MKVDRGRRRLLALARPADGFSLVEMLLVVALVAVVGATAIGVSGAMVRTAKGQSGVQQLAGFLKRTREVAISRRRNIEVAFVGPNVVSTQQRGVPPTPLGPIPAPTPLETMRLEGRIEFRFFPSVIDTPDDFVGLPGRTVPPSAIELGPALPVLFTSEGQFVDGNGDPVNATLFLGQPGQISTANALTILGTTALVRTWRWDGRQWVQ